MFGNKQPDNTPESELASVIDAGNRNNAENTRILSVIAADYLKERKARRRWSWVLRGLVFAYLGVVLFAWMNSRDQIVDGPHTALVELEGLISASATSADQINGSLRRAFKARSSKGVVLRINSPGGTPVQAALINDEIVRLKRMYPDKPMYVVVSDLCASGGYYVAVAADTIYAHPSSLVGSIGVRMDSFGAVDAMQKLGIERRLITAGENKGMLDPFLPLDPAQREHAEQMIGEVHQQFIDAVKRGRGDRLDESADLFSGLIWSGERAQSLGLIDEFGSAKSVARDVIGAERLVLYNPNVSLLEQFAKRLGVSIAAQVFGTNLTLR